MQVGIAIFSAGTLLTAVATGMSDMLIYRAATGVGEAMQLTALIAIATTAFTSLRIREPPRTVSVPWALITCVSPSSAYTFPVAPRPVILSLDANFLGDDPGSVRYAFDFVQQVGREQHGAALVGDCADDCTEDVATHYGVEA